MASETSASSSVHAARFADCGTFGAAFAPPAASKGEGSASLAHSILSCVYRWGVVNPERAPSHPLFVGAVTHGKPTILEGGAAEEGPVESIEAEELELKMGAIAESAKTGVLYVSSLLPPEAASSPQEIGTLAEKIAEAVVAGPSMEVLGASSAWLLASQATLGPETLQSLAALALSSSDTGGQVDSTMMTTARPADASAAAASGGGGGGDSPVAGVPTSVSGPGSGSNSSAGSSIGSAANNSLKSPSKRKSGLSGSAATPLRQVFDILNESAGTNNDNNSNAGTAIDRADSSVSTRSGGSGSSGLSIKLNNNASNKPSPAAGAMPLASPTPMAGVTGHDHMRPALHLTELGEDDSSMLSPSLGGLVTPAGKTPFPAAARRPAPLVLATSRTHQHHHNAHHHAGEELAHVVLAEANVLSDGLSSDGLSIAGRGAGAGARARPASTSNAAAAAAAEEKPDEASEEGGSSVHSSERDPDTIASLPSFAEVTTHLIDTEMVKVKPWTREAADAVFTMGRPPSITIHSSAPPPPAPTPVSSSASASASASNPAFSSALPFEMWRPYPVQQVVGEPAVAFAVANAIAKSRARQDKERGISGTSYWVAGDAASSITTAGLAVFEFSHPSLYDRHTESYLKAGGHHQHNHHHHHQEEDEDGSRAVAFSELPLTARVGEGSRPMESERNAALVHLSTATARYKRAEQAGFKLRCATVDDFPNISEAFYGLSAVAKGKKDPPAKEVAALQRAYLTAVAAGKALPHQLSATPSSAHKLTADQARAEWVNQRSHEIKASLANGEFYLLTAPEDWLVSKGLKKSKEEHHNAKIARKLSIGKEKEPALSSNKDASSSEEAPPSPSAKSAHSGVAGAWTEGSAAAATASPQRPRIPSFVSLVDSHGNANTNINSALAAEDAASTVPQVPVALVIVRGRNPYGARVAEVSVAEAFRRRGFALLLLSMLAHRLVSEEAVPSLALFSAEGDSNTARLMAKAGFVKRGTIAAVDIISAGVGGDGCFGGGHSGTGIAKGPGKCLIQ